MLALSEQHRLQLDWAQPPAAVCAPSLPPADQGHAGAGGYSSDSFCLDTSCGHWHQMAPAGDAPSPRGWLAATATPAGIAVHGGNSPNNERLGDLWMLELH